MLPEVGSTIVPPGLSFPSRSAASIIASPIRSLFDPPGFMYSSFASRVAGTSCEIRGSRTIGVFPTRSRTVGYSRAIGREAYVSTSASPSSACASSSRRTSARTAISPTIETITQAQNP